MLPGFFNCKRPNVIGLFGSTWFTYEGTKLVTLIYWVAALRIYTFALVKSDPSPDAPVKSKVPSSA